MNNLAECLERHDAILTDFDEPESLEVVQIESELWQRESLSENFNDEIEAWARHALASNGFGDY